MNYWRIRLAARVVAQGGVIAYPTEAVWGLGCDPFCGPAVERLLAMKRRPVSKGLILIASQFDQLGPLLQNLTESERSLISEPQSHPVTWLLPDDDDLIPYWIKGDHQEVAVRVSTHSVCRALCDAWGGLLVSTSANRSDEPPAMSATEVRAAFPRDLDAVLPGALGGYDKPSEIRSIRSGQVLRAGR